MTTTKGTPMVLRNVRRRSALAASAAAVLLGLLVSAQAASAAPFVRYAHFSHPSSPSFYTAFGDFIEISVAGSPTKTVVCISGTCKKFDKGEIHVAGGVFNQRWRRGQSRQVKVFACSATGCMPSVLVRQLTLP
jgi:hypothetical protein